MIREDQDDPVDYATLRHQARLVLLLDKAEHAGLVPLEILRLHTFAYLSNVLAPVWNMQVLDGKVLKRKGGPFYPALQRDLDRLVGMGVVVISSLGHVLDEEGRWRLEGSYRLNRKLAKPVLQYLLQFSTERRFSEFLQELAYAFSALPDDELDGAMRQDATYSDSMVDVGSVVDFAEWRNVNCSANAAHYFEHALPDGGPLTPGEMIHMYARHLHARIRGER